MNGEALRISKMARCGMPHQQTLKAQNSLECPVTHKLSRLVGGGAYESAAPIDVFLSMNNASVCFKLTCLFDFPFLPVTSAPALVTNGNNYIGHSPINIDLIANQV